MVVEKTIRVSNRAGVHARPAALIVQAAKDFICTIHIENASGRINGKSIMGIITLGAAYDTELTISAEGEDAEVAVDTIVKLIESKFEEV
jgi:phosphocarrier protein